MKTILSSQNYIQKIQQITEELSFSFERWDAGEMAMIYKKAIFENSLADYHSFKVLSKTYPNFAEDLSFEFSGTDLFIHLNIDSFVDASLPLTLWKNTKVTESLASLSTRRTRFLKEIENYLAKQDLENKIVITRTMVNWYNTLKRINAKFFVGRIKNISSESKKEMETSYFYSADIFRTFQNFTSKQEEKRILKLSPFINYLSIAFWFEGYDITIVSDHVNQLVSIAYTSDQYRDMINQNIFNPSSIPTLKKFTVLYDEDFLLNRFNKLEEKSYSACMINFVFSQSSKIDSEKITTQLNRIKDMMKQNSMILIQEASIIENLLDEILANLDIRVILKVRFIEHQEITNWLVIANKI